MDEDVIEGTRPQNSPSEAGNRLKSNKTDIHHTFSSLLICPECLNLYSTSLVFRDQYRHLAWLCRLPENSLPKTDPISWKVSLMWKLLAWPDGAATSCWCYLSFGSCTHIVDFAKSSHKCDFVSHYKPLIKI